MTGTEEFDLIVVGAGPAGAAATLYAQRHGLRVLLLDRAVFPRDKTCGDALSGRSLTVLDELGLLDEVRGLPGARIDHILFASPNGSAVRIDLPRQEHGGTHANPSPMGQGQVVRRADFDAFLFSKARLAAAACVPGFAVRTVVRDHDGLCVVGGRLQASGERADREFRGRLVFGCDGYSSVVARSAGLYVREPRHLALAVRGYFENVTGLERQIELHYIDEVLPGYFWLFPVGDNCANVGICVHGADPGVRGRDLQSLLQRIVASPRFAGRFAGARAVAPAAVWPLPLGSARRHLSGDGVLLLGDAAGLVDPFTGEGIGNALVSARLAVAVAVEALSAGDCTGAFLGRYEDRLWARLGRELGVSTRLQGLARSRCLLNFVLGKASRSPEMRDLISGMLAKSAPRSLLTKPLFYLRLLFR